MKRLFRISIFLGVLIALLACELASQVTPTPVPSPTERLAFQVTFLPSQTATATATLELIPTLSYNSPRLFPTFDPTSVPRLLSEAFSLQTVEGANGQTLRRITGWEYGFRQTPCCGYQWLDASHLLLYPRTGEEMRPFQGGERKEDVSSQPVIMNLESGHSWLPWSNTPAPIYFSQELGIVFQQELYGSATGPTQPAVSVFNFDGQEIARYWGKILDVSPSGAKILVDDDTIIDLRNGKITDLAWHMDYDFESPGLYWSSDERRIYRCCFYFADLKSGKSYNFEWSDMRGVDGKPVSYSMHTHTDGEWVRNDSYFLVKWDYWTVSYGDPIPMFSPMEKKYYDLAEMAGIPSDFIPYSTYTISPDGMYVWIRGGSNADGIIHGFLVNLTTFETISYNDFPVEDFVWSPDSKFAWLTVSSSNGSRQPQLLSVSDKKMEPLHFSLLLDAFPVWHPTEPVLANINGDGQKLQLLNAQTMTNQELVLPAAFQELLWSPDGDHIALVAEDESLWQVDYPNLENLEQLMSSLPDVRNVEWSPDSSSITFISGSDIYIVDTMK